MFGVRRTAAGAAGGFLGQSTCRRALPLMNAEQLLRHGSFLRGLARSLVRDAARADDVVQDAWLAALRDRHGIRTPRAWLAGVVRHLTRRHVREERRRRLREESVATARGHDARATVDVAAQEEARRQVVRAVLSLDEPYRTTIVLRYYDGLKPREIATREGVTASTIRTRVQRGLAMLRARLEESNRDWARGLVPLAAAAPLGSGALLAVAAAVALVGATVWAAWPAHAPDRTRGALATRTHSAALPDPSSGTRSNTPSTAPSDAPPSMAANNPKTSPSVRDPSESDPESTRRAQTADDDTGQDPSYPDNTLVAVFRLRDGRIEDQAETNSRANVAGEPGLPGVNAGRFLVVVAGPDHIPVAALRDTVQRPYEGHHVSLPRIEFEPALSIRGRVVDSAGAPVPDVEVRARLVRHSGRILDVPGRDQRFVFDGEQAALYGTAARTLTDGTYRITGLAEDEYEIWCEAVGGAHGSVTYDIDDRRYVARARAPGVGHDFTIARGRLALEIVDATGQPVSGATIRIGVPGGEERHERCDARFAQAYFPGTRQRFTIEKTGFEPLVVEAEAPLAARKRTARVVLLRHRDAGALQINVHAASGSPPKNYGFRLTPIGGGKTIQRTVGLRDAAFVLNDLPPGRYRMSTRATGWSLVDGGFLEDLEIDVVVEPARTRKLELRPRATGRLRLSVRTPTGTTKIAATVQITTADGEEQRVVLVKGGRGGYVSRTNRLPAVTGDAYVATALLPGVYRVRIETRTGDSATAEVKIEAGKTARAEFVIGAP